MRIHNLHYFNVDTVHKLGELNALRLERTYAVGRHFKLKQLAPTLLCSELSFVFRKH